jgi:hypothetical protein
VGVAKANVSSAAVPGSWPKFYHSPWSQNGGYHGESDAIANITGTAAYSFFNAAATASPSTRTGKDEVGLISISPDSSPSYGMHRLAFSRNGTALYPLMQTDGSWKRGTDAPELVACVSLVPELMQARVALRSVVQRKSGTNCDM